MQLELDAGEGEPEELWGLVDALAIACGGHAGDDAAMTRAIAGCARLGLTAGAHPSYIDREGFGRRTIEVAPAVLAEQVFAQCEALARIGRDHGVTIAFAKPHGALYHDAAREPAIADAVMIGVVRALGAVAIIGPSWGATKALRDAAVAHGSRYLREGFADRALRPDGSLVPLGEPGAVLADPAAAVAQARALADRVDTLCIHGDSPDALAIARAVRAALG
ncbi:MAG: LamB/YcsF family protein [Kofleriaceae bacterium]